jgi:hypothetical protein
MNRSPNARRGGLYSRASSSAGASLQPGGTSRRCFDALGQHRGSRDVRSGRRFVRDAELCAVRSPENLGADEAEQEEGRREPDPKPRSSTAASREPSERRTHPRVDLHASGAASSMRAAGSSVGARHAGRVFGAASLWFEHAKPPGAETPAGTRIDERSGLHSARSGAAARTALGPEGAHHSEGGLEPKRSASEATSRRRRALNPSPVPTRRRRRTSRRNVRVTIGPLTEVTCEVATTARAGRHRGDAYPSRYAYSPFARK